VKKLNGIAVQRNPPDAGDKPANRPDAQWSPPGHPYARSSDGWSEKFSRTA